MRSSSQKLIRNIDPVLAIVYVVLMLFGLATIYASAYTEEYSNLFSFEKEYGKQVVWIFVSLIMGVIVFILVPDFSLDFHFSSMGLFFYY